MMYSVAQLRQAFSAPSLVLRELNRLFYTRFDSVSYNRDGVAIMDEDWDNLLLLDACRYDMFEAQASLPGTLERRVSRGSNTAEFLRGNFAGREMHDTVYVTANPQFRRYEDSLDASFHHVVDIWQDDDWDRKYNTVLPETTAARAREAAESFPDKRLLVHFIQPHYPFIDEDSRFDKKHLHRENGETDDFWHRIMVGDLEVEETRVWSLYRRTLDATLPHLESLLEDLHGRTVVTSDHGNMVGERARPIPVREWGHPESIHTEELVEVPWLVHESGERRTVVAEEPAGRAEVDQEAVVDRLRDLGYRE